jgi:hypothetical protein
MGVVRLYTAAAGGAQPRLVAAIHGGRDPQNSPSLVVWDSGTAAFLCALNGPEGGHDVWSLLTYQLSDGRPRIAAGFNKGNLCIYDGDDFHLVHNIQAGPEGHRVDHLAVYEEPTSGKTSLSG